MKKYFMNKPVVFIFLSFLAFLLAMGMIYNPSYQAKPKVYDVSVLCAQGGAERFQNFRQGALQAAEDLNVNLRFSYTKSESGIQHQKELLEQELLNSSEAIIMIPYSDHATIMQICSEAKKPIIYAYSHVIKDESNYVGSNGMKMGNEFALEITRRGNYRKNIAIVVNNDMNHTEKMILSAMQADFRTALNHVEVLSFHPEESKDNLCRIIDTNQYNVVVCFDNILCQQLVEHQSKHNVEIYAIGSNSILVDALEEEKINALLVQDEYSIGYLSVKTTVEAIKEGKNNALSNVHYAIIDKEHMYDNVNERLLFPIVR